MRVYLSADAPAAGQAASAFLDGGAGAALEALRERLAAAAAAARGDADASAYLADLRSLRDDVADALRAAAPAAHDEL